MLKATKDLIKIIETRASEPNACTEAEQLLQQGADITASTNTGSMIHSVIAEEKRYRLIIPWRADNCQYLIQVLQNGASNRLSAQVFAANGGDLQEMHKLVELKASCYQSTIYGPLGLLGSLLKQDKISIRLDIVQFLMKSDVKAQYTLTMVDSQQQTILSLAKGNPNCSQDVINYIQQYFDDVLNQIPFAQPHIDPSEVLIWIRRGANIEAIDTNGNTVLTNAVIADNLKLVRVLVSVGSNTAHRNKDKLTPLQIAKKAIPKNPALIAILETQPVNAELKHLIETKKSQLTIEDVRTQLENGADINATIVNYDSFLHLLIANEGTPEMMLAFINDFNADLTAANTSGYRPIETCILVDKDPFVYLLAILKSPKMTTALFNNSTLNKTLLQFAIDTERFEAAKLIQDELNLRLWDCMVGVSNTKEGNHDVIMTKVKNLVTYGAQINHKHHDREHREQTVLHSACEIGAEQLVKLMIKDLQADYTLQNYDGDYPISIAAKYGYLSIVIYLCNLPSLTIHLLNKDQETPLHLATKNRHLLVVRYLVKCGADHQSRNLFEQTPLDMARANISKNKEEEKNDKKLINFLAQLICPSVDDSLQKLSNATQPSYDLDTCELVVPVIINSIPINNDDTEDTSKQQKRGLFSVNPNNKLHEAAKNGSVWEAQKAIGQGADIRYRKANRTPHDVALLSKKEYNSYLDSTTLSLVNRATLQNMVNGCQQIADIIQQIAQTKLVEAIDQSNASLVMSYHLASATLSLDLLYRACNVSDNIEMVDYLLNQGVNISQAMSDELLFNSLYRTVKKKSFHKLANYLKYRLSVECTKAIKENNLEIVKKLVYAGANVDMHDTNNLNVALEHQNADLIQFLCENGAKMPLDWLTAKTIVLEPPLAQQLKSDIVFRINQCLINRRLRFAAASGDLDGVIRCQRLGADINSVNCHGSTALLYAIQYGNYFRIVHTLVSCGASILHSNDDEPMSLIDLAKKKNHRQIVSYLSNELNVQFLTAIINNDRESAEKFAQLGAEFNFQDEQKRTALHYAVQNHGADLVTWLLECGSVPTICDVYGDYPIIQATEKGDYRMVELFVTKYPATKKQTNKAGLTALQIAQKLQFTRITELIETGKVIPEYLNDMDGKTDAPKHDYETLIEASRDGHIRIIQQFISQRYESKETKKRLCHELIQVAKQAKQFQILDILEPYYKTKLRTELASDMELGGGVVTLNEYHRRMLLGFLNGLSTLIANSSVVLDPADPTTYVDLFSGLTANIEKRSQELQQVGSEQDVEKLIEKDETNTKEQLIQINQQLQQLSESKNSLKARVQDTDERLFKEQHLTALQRKEFIKEKEIHRQQLASYECSIFLFRRQQEAISIRQKTIDFIKGNTNLIMFYRTIENRLEALFYSSLAAQTGYLKREATTKYGKPLATFDKLPILNIVSASIKTVIGPVLSRLDEKEQRKEWHNISTLGNIEELKRIASDTAGLITLYYREQIQFIDSSQKIKGSNVLNDKINSLKQVIDVRPESSEEMAVVMVAEYITGWIIDALKLGKETLTANESLPQQLWLCVAKKNPIDDRKTTKLTDAVGISVGQQKISLKSRNLFDEEIIVQVQLRYLIGYVSVVANDGSIYQCSISKNFFENESEILEVFGYVYVTPFSTGEKALQAIVEGRKLQLAKWDQDGKILTRFEEITEYAQTYVIQNDKDVGQSLITNETANLVADVLRQRKIFLDATDVKDEIKKTQEIIELSIDVLREEIQEKTKFYQLSIDAAHEQLKQESTTNRETMKKDNEIHHEQTRNKLNEQMTEIEKRLEQLIDKRVNDIEDYMEGKTRQILTIAETAKAQSLQAIAEANQAIQFSQQLLNQATQATASAQNLMQWAEQQHQQFQLTIKHCEGMFRRTVDTQKESYERTISEIRERFERECEHAREAVYTSATNARESAQAAQQSALNTSDIQKMTKYQLDLQKKESGKIIAEAKDTRHQSERAAAEAREAQKQAKRAADACITAVDKVNSIHEKVETRLEQIEKVTKK